MEDEIITIKDSVWLDKGIFNQNNNKTGLWKRYYNERLISKHTYLDGELHGFWETYYNFHKAQIILQNGYYFYGKRTGVTQYFDSKEEIKTKCFYV